MTFVRSQGGIPETALQLFWLLGKYAVGSSMLEKEAFSHLIVQKV